MALFIQPTLFPLLLFMYHAAAFQKIFSGKLTVGAWRSLVAHYNGVVGVEGSNPFAPTNIIKDLQRNLQVLFFLGYLGSKLSSG